MKSRFGIYESYIKRVERVQASNIARLVNSILMLTGKTDRPKKVMVNMGPIVTQDIRAKIDAIGQELELFKMAKPVLERALTDLNYSDEQQTEIMSHMESNKQQAEQAGQAQQQPQRVNSLLQRLNKNVNV